MRDAEIQTENYFQYFRMLEKFCGKKCVTRELLPERDNEMSVKDKRGK